VGDRSHALVLWRTEHSLLTAEDLAQAVGVQPGIVEAFITYRLIVPSVFAGSCELFTTDIVGRLERILRLRQDFGVNLAGVGVILEMTERMEDLQRELESLRNR
jgi:MerR family transcriptional regulator/heat shock protein HspR